MTKHGESFAAIVRKAIHESGLSRYEISKQTGVEESVLSRFVSGERSMNLDTLDRLRSVLKLELKRKRRR